MNYAIIKTGGKQYQVEEGKEILVDRIEAVEASSVDFPDVLLTRLGDDVLVGTPIVADARVTGKLVEQVKGDKIRVSKFKAKVNYRKTMGFRAQLSRILIESITVGGNTAEKKSKKA
jgi:large subunit ribosomal protein L21